MRWEYQSAKPRQISTTARTQWQGDTLQISCLKNNIYCFFFSTVDDLNAEVLNIFVVMVNYIFQRPLPSPNTPLVGLINKISSRSAASLQTNKPKFTGARTAAVISQQS